MVKSRSIAWFFTPLLVLSIAHLVNAEESVRPGQSKPVFNGTTLRPFYRSTQLQGHLFGQGLQAIPDYLQDPSLAFPYRRKAKSTAEIPFVDSFTINRVMGGYPEDWLRKFNLIKPELGRRSLDFAVRSPNGSLQFHPELIEARLKPYIDAGYKPADITLTLDNTPWDLATSDGHPPVEGAWGRKTPPGDLAEWSIVVRQLALAIKAYLGPAAEQIGFETGVEFDERSSFDGNAGSFFGYYKATDEALHSVLPAARMSPGEFTGGGTCPLENHNCVYDTRDFLEFAREHKLQVSTVPRSLHAFADKPHPLPIETAQRSAMSYRRLPPAIAEIHQFGLLFEPFGEDAGGDPGPRQASWEFQTLIDLLADDAPRRVFHWGGFSSVGPLPFLNGSGFLRLVLDHYLGRQLSAVPIEDDPTKRYAAESMGVMLMSSGASALILSSFSPDTQTGARTVSVAALQGWSEKTHFKSVRYDVPTSVFAEVKKDLQAERNLKPDFESCASCLGTPMMMAGDANRARSMLGRNWPRYVQIMKHGLTWNMQDNSIRIEGGRLKADLDANALIVIEPE